MSVSYGGDSITFADGSVQSGGWTGMKNRIINGAMVIDQRNAGAAVSTGYPVDRFRIDSNVGSKSSQQQNAGGLTGTSVPSGFRNYVGCTSSGTYSVAAGEIYIFDQPIEGYNIADLNWGFANAQPVTLSFWVRSSLTGTFGGSLVSSSANRSYPFTYTINSANTWEQKSITIAGDTSGTWNTTNGTGVLLSFNLATGSTYSGTAGAWAGAAYYSATGAQNPMATSGATWYITGVQLERGSTASSFEYRSYGAELALCQRYAIVYGRDSGSNQIGGTGFAYGTTNGDIPVAFPVEMRATPTLAYSGGANISDGAAATAVTALTVISSQSSPKILSMRFTVASGATTFRPYRVETTSNTAFALFSAEL